MIPVPFPHFRITTNMPGIFPDLEDAEPVEPSHSRSREGTNFDDMNSGSALHLIFGQRWLTEQTNAVFSKYVTKKVITEDRASGLFRRRCGQRECPWEPGKAEFNL